MGTSPATPGAPAPNPIVSFVPLLVVFGILYFLILRPQQKQAREHRKMLDALKKGDRVLTQGGLYGTVVNLKGSVVEVKIAENVKIEMSKTAVTQVLNPGGDGSSPEG